MFLLINSNCEKMEEVISGMVSKGLAENAFSVCFNSKDERLWMSYVSALDSGPNIFDQIDIAGLFFFGWYDY